MAHFWVLSFGQRILAAGILAAGSACGDGARSPRPTEAAAPDAPPAEPGAPEPGPQDSAPANPLPTDSGVPDTTPADSSVFSPGTAAPLFIGLTPGLPAWVIA